MEIKPRPIKRLIWDIEVSPNVVLAFSAGFKLNIAHDQIIQERKIICIGSKFEDEKKVTMLRWDKNQDDKSMVMEFVKIASEADELIHQNGNKFDLPWLRTRCLFHGLGPLPDWKTIDTLKLARSSFYFNSNKLDYLSSFLGYGKKVKTDFDLWKDVMNGDKEALQKMCDYCAHDVLLTEKVYHRLKLYVKPKTHAGVLLGRERWSDPRTGSTNVEWVKTRTTASGLLQHQMRNRDDGSYFTLSATAFKLFKKS